MKDIYVCSGCGFVSSIRAEFVKFEGKHICIPCAYDECRKEDELERAQNTEQLLQPDPLTIAT